jgi:hypothetical protein
MNIFKEIKVNVIKECKMDVNLVIHDIYAYMCICMYARYVYDDNNRKNRHVGDIICFIAQYLASLIKVENITGDELKVIEGEKSRREVQFSLGRGRCFIWG